MEYIDNIEYLNALTPFDHGPWTGMTNEGKDIIVGEKALFINRSFWLLEKISSYLSDNFTNKELAKLKILEIGSYDGWIITNLCQRFNFQEVVGLEPRKKNIMNAGESKHT